MWLTHNKRVKLAPYGRRDLGDDTRSSAPYPNRYMPLQLRIMPTLDSINDLLSEAAKKLDQAAGEIRDAPAEPTKEHINRIGEALANIFHIQHQIYELRPDLKPPHLDQELKEPEDNRALGQAMVNADALANAGQAIQAIKVLESFISSYPSSELRSIAEGEIARYKGAGT